MRHLIIAKMLADALVQIWFKQVFSLIFLSLFEEVSDHDLEFFDWVHNFNDINFLLKSITKSITCLPLHLVASKTLICLASTVYQFVSKYKSKYEIKSICSTWTLKDWGATLPDFIDCCFLFSFFTSSICNVKTLITIKSSNKLFKEIIL